MSGRNLCHLHAGRIAFGQDAELVGHAPTTPPLAPGDDLDRPAAHDLTDDLTPDVKAASLNGRQRPGKAAEAGRLRPACTCCRSGWTSRSGSTPQDYWAEKDEFPAIDLTDAAFRYR